MDYFEKYMNPPEDGFDGQADIKVLPGGSQWVVCPWCGKKALRIQKETKIEHLQIQCRGSNCKKKFNVDVNLKGDH